MKDGRRRGRDRPARGLRHRQVKAEAAGLKVMNVADAARWADIVIVLTPDELQATSTSDHLEANMKQGAAL